MSGKDLMSGDESCGNSCVDFGRCEVVDSGNEMPSLTPAPQQYLLNC